MKTFSLAALLFLFAAFNVNAQTKTPGPVEQKLLDSLCIGLAKIDLTKISTKQEANDAFMECFTSYAFLLMDVAKERGVEFGDDAAMHQIGTDIGASLLKNKCTAFMKLATLMAGSDSKLNSGSGVTQGKLKRIDNKGFNYFVITDAAGKEQSFIWLRQFAGYEKFTGSPVTYAGKKLKIRWQEMEVYLPGAKGYYKVKEISQIEILK
ncbi:hypothetical protein [Mucilaginibacter aquatilis]|uniref:DUF4919 domain-containing protein n=1 Tax=Mucilaginibacter aquatilis TaxID=1517760 RepID=A0A6I4IRG6_9SPHI|nr:hypothetical protein [Mucilaginibacter aquatilis]MVN92844.1 hypothetical protein [Mucilaginibacter aquatilis]